jgi:hypothetical protein
VKRLKGSGRRIKPPVESMLTHARGIVLKADQMRVLELAVDIAENTEGMGHLINEVPRSMVPQLGPEIADQISAINKRLEDFGGSLTVEPGLANMDELGAEHLTFFAPAVMPKNGEYGYIPMWRNGQVRWYEINKTG